MKVGGHALIYSQKVVPERKIEPSTGQRVILKLGKCAERSNGSHNSSTRTRIAASFESNSLLADNLNRIEVIYSLLG